MSIPELKALAQKHWTEYLPKKVQELRAEGTLNEELRGAATLAQAEIETLMSRGYLEHEAREVALPIFIMLKPELDEGDWEAQELAEKERSYQENVAPYLSTSTDEDEDLPIR